MWGLFTTSITPLLLNSASSLFMVYFIPPHLFFFSAVSVKPAQEIPIKSSWGVAPFHSFLSRKRPRPLIFINSDCGSISPQRFWCSVSLNLSENKPFFCFIQAVFKACALENVARRGKAVFIEGSLILHKWALQPKSGVTEHHKQSRFLISTWPNKLGLTF